MRRLNVKPQAADELAEVVAWLEAQELGLGRRFEPLAKAALDRACDYPTSFPVFSGELRRILVSPFKFGVIYAIEPDRIVVVAVLDLKRDPRTIDFRLREEP